MNTVCDACQAPLGVELVESRGSPFQATAALWMSLAITAPLILVTAALDLHPGLVAGAMFWGPLVAAWRSRENAVAYAAIGGIVAFISVMLVAFVVYWAQVRELLGAVIRAEAPTYDPYIGDRPGTSSTVIAIAGSIAAVMLVAPTALIGATVGDALARRRRGSLEPKHQL